MALDQSQATTATAIPTTRICQMRPVNSRLRSEMRQRFAGGGLGVAIVTAQKSSTLKAVISGHAPAVRASYVALIHKTCNECFMIGLSKSSPLSELRSALPSLPMRLQEVGRFVAANDYDATTRSMRDLAAEAGADPAAFTRLAKALGYSGWDELRGALTEARRPAQTSPFSGRAKRRHPGPNSDVALITDKLEAEAVGLTRISASSIADAAKTLHAARRIWIAGFRSCRSV